MVVVGSTYPPNSQPYADIAVARVNSTGQLDTSFGTSGKLTIDFSELGFYAEFFGFYYPPPYPAYDTATGVAIQPDGSISIFGVSDLGTGGYVSVGVTALLTSSGAVVSKDLGDGGSHAAMTVQADGKTIEVGTLDGDFAVTRRNRDGSSDLAFGLRGTQPVDFGGYDFATAVAIQADGRIVIAGYDSDQGLFAMARLEGFGLSVVGTQGDDNITIAPGTQAGTLKTTVNGLVTDNMARQRTHARRRPGRERYVHRHGLAGRGPDPGRARRVGHLRCLVRQLSPGP